MSRWRVPQTWLKILLPVLLVVLAGTAPRPHNYTRHMHLAAQSLERGLPDAAAQHLLAAAQYSPTRTDFYEPAGLQALAAGEPDLAIQALTLAEQVAPLSLEAQLALGDAYSDTGNLSSALSAWDAALPAPEAYYRTIDAFLTQKDYISAAQALQELLADQPNLPGESFQVGLLLAALDPLAALPFLEKAAALDPAQFVRANTVRDAIRTASLFEEPAYTYVASGRALASLDEWELAAIAFQEAVHLRSDYAEAWAFLGEAHQHLPDVAPGDPQALQMLTTAVSLDPYSLPANLFMAAYYRRSQEYENALIYLNRAVDIEPDNINARAELGAGLAESGDLIAALAAYQDIVELQPDQSSAWMFLAQFCLTYQVQVHDIGLPAARQAVLLAPNVVQTHVLLGTVLLELDDHLNAARTFERAVAINPAYAPAHLHLGLAYILLQDTARGRSELELAIALDPGGPAAFSALNLFEQYFP